MSGSRSLPDQPVSDQVLAELHAAFSAADVADATGADFDFDDPSIDRLLGVHVESATPSEGGERDAVGAEVDVPEVAPPDPVAPKPTSPPVVVIDDDEQLPDTVYLEDDTVATLASTGGGAEPWRSSRQPVGLDPGIGGEAGARSTIVIDHLDDHTDSIVTQPASSIDPRLKARRVAVNRAAGRRRLLWVGVAAGVVLVAVAVVAVLASTTFDVRNVRVQSEYTDPALIERIVDELRGTPILRVDTAKYERELEASPWVESAKVTTDFPHDVTIDIRERHPQAAFVGSDGQWRVIDRDGRVLAVLGSRPLAYMPITGTAPDSEAGQFAGPVFAAAAQLVIGLPPEIRSITSSVGVDATTGELSLALDPADATGVQVRLGTVAGMEDKLARLLTFVRQGLKPDQKLDVSTADVAT